MQQSARATYLLEQTIKRNSSLPLLAKSARLLEEVIAGQKGTGKAFLPAHTWKNLGLAYAHMARNTAEDFPPGAPAPISDLVTGTIGQPWRERATQRLVEAWSQFLAEPEAKQILDTLHCRHRAIDAKRLPSRQGLGQISIVVTAHPENRRVSKQLKPGGGRQPKGEEEKEEKEQET